MFVVAWMAGLLYLPRIFVYHSMDDTTDETSNVFKLMEKRLFAIKISMWVWLPPFQAEI